MPVNVIEDAKAVARHRRAALYVEQRLIPGVADLAGKEADAIGFGASGEAEDRSRLTRVLLRSAQSPWASRPNTQVTGLPAIADLAADEASGPLAAAAQRRRSQITSTKSQQLWL